MRIRSLLPAAALAFAAAATAAPPLEIPFPRQSPEKERRMVEEAEEALRRAEDDEVFAIAAGTAAPPAEAADAEPAGTPEAPPVLEPPELPAVPEAPSLPEIPEPAPAGEESAPRSDAESAPADEEPAPRSDAEADPAGEEPAPGPDAASADSVFRRDPFWPVAVARARKADHDAAVAARIEAENRAIAIRKAREDAIKKGLDVSDLDDDQLEALGAEDGATIRKKPKAPSKIGGATEEEWEEAEAKLPPRSGYLGGGKPALMLKGDKRPRYVGDELCVTNRGVVFTWRVSKVDFRAYAHELKKISAEHVTP